MYRLGKGVAQDDKLAAQWFRRAAEQGDASAQYNLAMLYRQGRGLAEDDKAAAQWLRRAAEQGYALAQSGLGLMYATGEGMPEDTVYAHMWANIAASGGGEEKARNRPLRGHVLNLVGQKMTSSQLARARQLARECVRKQYKDC